MEKLINQYLNNTLSKEEELELFAWIVEKEEHKVEFIRVRRILLAAKYSAERENIDIEKELEQFRAKAKIIKKRNWNKTIVIAATIAASIIITIVSVGILPKQEKQADPIRMFANNDQSVSVDEKETQLILGEDNIISVDEKESTITYDETGITVNNAAEAISKTESSSFNQLRVPYGKRSSITFSDGTKVWANAGTRLIYPIEFDAKTREIFVEGEVLLDVAKDVNRPFIVKTSDIEVQVLGTKFNIAAYANDVIKRVVLVSGAVHVKNKEGNFRESLSPNKMYEYNSDAKTKEVSVVNVDKYILWHQGTYSYSKQLLSEVTSQISKYYGVEVNCDEESSVFVCSGRLNLRDNIDEVLSGLSNSVPITYQTIGNTYEIKMQK